MRLASRQTRVRRRSNSRYTVRSQQGFISTEYLRHRLGIGPFYNQLD
nr:MAG TPA: hypothetical protein [Caudoviricetes sp.]